MNPVIAVVVLLQGVPATRDTVAGRPCRVAVDSMGHYAEIPNSDGTKTIHGGGGVLAHCDGTNTTISADSFVLYGALGRLDLIGRVVIRDTALALDAHYASYFLKDERLEAHNNVIAVNRRTGSVLRGPNLKYWRAVKGVRDTVEMYATQRPTVEYRQSQPADSGPQEPYIIVADRLHLKGDDRMWAGGKVTVDRSLQQTFAWGASARPQAISALYTIRSDSLAIDSPGEVLTESRAFGKAFATAKRDSITPANQTDWVTGDSITIRFTQDEDSITKRKHSRLRELVARGAARALTHHSDKTDTTKVGPAINYSRGHVITLSMLRDRIDRVVVVGSADGVHLEPRPAVEADSLKRAQADTTRRAPASLPVSQPPPPPPPPLWTAVP